MTCHLSLSYLKWSFLVHQPTLKKIKNKKRLQSHNVRTGTEHGVQAKRKKLTHSEENGVWGSISAKVNVS